MNNSSKPLLVWWIVTVIVAAISYWLNYYGIFSLIYVSDISHITQLIAAVFLIGNFRIGWLAFKWYKIQDKSWVYLRDLKKHLDEWWFVASSFMALGILGTVAGISHLFFIAFAPLMGDTFTAAQLAEIVPTLLPQIIAPLGTVFFTTAVGLAGSLLLRYQLFLFISFSGINDERYEK